MMISKNKNGSRRNSEQMKTKKKNKKN